MRIFQISCADWQSNITTEGSARLRVGVKRPPMGAVGRCPAVPGEVCP